jgi:hypothetical protein
VAPEKGKDLNVRQVATRIMKLAETNSKGFQRPTHGFTGGACPGRHFRQSLQR